MKKWRTKDGDYLEVNLMETRHVKNILKGLRHGKNFGTISYVGTTCGDDIEVDIIDKKQEWIDVFEKELTFRELSSDTPYYNEYPERNEQEEK